MEHHQSSVIAPSGPAKPPLVPPKERIVNSTNLIIATTSGLFDTELLALAELIVGKSEWVESTPRPCFPDWISSEGKHSGKEIYGTAEKMILMYFMKMVEEQQPEMHDAIKTFRKHIKPLGKRNPIGLRPRLEDIKVWEEDGKERHNVAILNKREELRAAVDPIRASLGFPEELKFYETRSTREKYEYIMENLDTMISIMFMDSFDGPKSPEPKDAVPRISDRSMEKLIDNFMEKGRE